MATTAKGTPYVESSDLVANYPAASLALANQVDLFGNILQVIRATDVTNRATTSTSFVDVTGMAVAITPKKSTSNILLISSFNYANGSGATDTRSYFQITDSSNNAISGAEGPQVGQAGVGTGVSDNGVAVLIGYVAAGSTSARTYKLRFRTINASSTANAINAVATGQMYAIEVSA